MDSCKTFWVGLAFAVVLTGQNGWSQERSDDGDVFGGIKIRMAAAVEENKMLTEQNRSLKAKLVELQLEMNQYAPSNDGLKDREAVVHRPAHVRTGWPAEFREAVESDALAQEVMEIYRSGRTMDLDSQQRLRELYLYDLLLQKQELELEIESKKPLYQALNEQRRAELDDLEKEINQLMRKESDLSAKAAGLQQEAAAHPRQVELLKAENKMLRQRIQKLKQARPR